MCSPRVLAVCCGRRRETRRGSLISRPTARLRRANCSSFGLAKAPPARRIIRRRRIIRNSRGRRQTPLRAILRWKFNGTFAVASVCGCAPAAPNNKREDESVGPSERVFARQVVSIGSRLQLLQVENLDEESRPIRHSQRPLPVRLASSQSDERRARRRPPPQRLNNDT